MRGCERQSGISLGEEPHARRLMAYCTDSSRADDLEQLGRWRERVAGIVSLAPKPWCRNRSADLSRHPIDGDPVLQISSVSRKHAKET